jgi:hypothetical protein
MIIILTAFFIIISGWLKNFIVIANRGKFIVLALVKNLIVSALHCRARDFKKAINVSTSSSSQKLNLKEIRLFKKGWERI